MNYSDYVPPEFYETAFSCPYCKAQTQQIWVRMTLDSYTYVRIADNQCLYMSTCIRCKNSSLWLAGCDSNPSIGKMIYPKELTAPFPHPDMPDNVKKLYEEARSVSSDSPRSSVTLLRCSAEELIKGLKVPGKTFDEKIGNLVKEGLEEEIKDGFDALRVIGNEAGAHVGCIDLSSEDNVETVNDLFDIMNFLVQKLITDPKQRQRIKDKISQSKKDAIARRDRKES